MTASVLLAMLANHVWQSSLCFLLAAALALALRRAPARVRFAIWTAASLKWLVPFAALRALGALIPWRHPALVAPPPPLAFAIQPFHAIPAAAASALAPLAAAPPHHWAAWALAVSLSGVWCAGTVMIAALWTLRWWRMARAVRAAEPLAVLPLRAVQSPLASEPGIFGIFHPVLVLPAGFAAQLGPEQLAAVVAHEESHVRRRDNLWALLHMAAQAAFWFHPFLWWTGRAMLTTREQACDAAVVAAGLDPEAYVETLLRMCRSAVALPLPCMAGIAGGDLKLRIAAILSDGFARRLARPTRWALVALGMAVVAVPIAAGLGAGAALVQNPAPALAFEVATLRVDTIHGGVQGGCRGFDSKSQDPRFAVPLGRCLIVGGRLSHMMSIAFNLPMERISGYPAWDGPSRWEVEAEVEHPRAATESQLLTLLQNFLVKQFHLQLRHETKLASTYFLEVSNPAKLHPAPAQENRTLAPDADGRLHLQAWSMPELADFLSGIPTVGRPVADHTHLAGRYDFTVEFLSQPAANVRAFKAGLANWQTVFQDLRSQLGLKLESAQSPVQTIVITSATKPRGCPCSQ